MQRSTLSLMALCAGLGALPALAQDNQRIVIDTKSATATATASCGTHALPWLMESLEGSTINGQSAPLSQSIALSSRDAGFAFHVTEANTVLRIELDGEQEGDTVLKVLDTAGEVVGENDDFGSSLNSRIDLALQPGTYCAMGLSLGDDFSAVMQVGLEAHPARITGEGIGSIAACSADTQAQTFGQGPLEAAFAQGPTRQTVSGAQTEYLRFSLAEATPLTLTASANGPDPKVALFDAQGQQIAENDDDGNGINARLDFPNALQAGEYCLGVTSLNGDAGDIVVEAQKLDREAFLMAAYKRGELVPSSASGYKIDPLDLTAKEPTVALLGSDALWYSFDLDRETVFMATAYGKLAGADTKLALFDDRGQPISENDDTNASTDAQLGPVLLGAGSYRMVLTDLNASGSGSARATLLNIDLFYRAQ